MSLKSHLIDCYRIASFPARKWNFAKLKQAGQVPIYSMFYHRIADKHPNPWSMSRAEFEQQISWLQQKFDIVDLEECQRRIRSGSNRIPTVSITFDDGYAENCDYAIPMLIERKIPITYFVTTHNTFDQVPFQHDVDLGQPLATNTMDELKEIARSEFIEIGAHTRTHPDLGKIHDEARLIDEVITSSRELEAVVEQKIRYFAFPFGQRENLNAAAFKLLEQEGFLGACTTINRWNEIGGDPFQIARVHGDPSFARIRNWLSFSAELDKQPHFDY